MLDDLKYIHTKDLQDALGIAAKQWQQLEAPFDLTDQNVNVNNIVFSGMGGSALAAELSLTWPTYKIPFEITKDYQIPAYINDTTLFIASSYSGNTEETVETLNSALKLTKNIVVIASGGKLEEIAQDLNLYFIKLPSGLQPRHATLYSYKALLEVLQSFGLISESSEMSHILDAVGNLKDAVKNWLPEIHSTKNLAKKIALDLAGKSVVIYSSKKFYPAAYKWKISFNENSKNIAWCNYYSEFNHNEFLGWTSHPTQKPYAVINLKSDFDNPRILKRMDLSERMLSGRKPAAIDIKAIGNNEFSQLLYLVALGDFVSIYLAICNGINPTPVDLIEKFKTELSK